MKERLTYIVDEQSDFDPDKVDVGKNGVLVNEASKSSGFQYRVTADFMELPQQLVTDLEGMGDVHFRWISPKNFNSKAPFTSRSPLGLHVFYKHPTKATVADPERTDVCRLVVRLFGWKLDCDTLDNSFTILPALSEYGSGPLYQFHYELETTLHTQIYLVRQLCKTDTTCIAKVSTLGTASYLDIDFIEETRTATLTTYYERAPDLAGEFLDSPENGNRLEVGILTQETADAQGEVKLGGYLVDVGVDKKLTNTRFSTPSRHLKSLPSRSISFQQPTGLHPKMTVSLSGPSLTPPVDSCTLHAYFTLPSAVFIDRYQFTDTLFLSSQNLVALQSLSGEDDLEAPDWVITKWGSTALFELAAPPASSALPGTWNITIPTHLRYMAPSYKSENNKSVEIDVPHPSIFWACQLLVDEDDRLDTNPFDRMYLGYDRLFPSNTSFFPVVPATSSSTDGKSEPLFTTVTAPVLDSKAKDWVPTGTLLVVVLGFAWVCWQLLKPKGKKGQKKKLAKPPVKKTN